MAKKKTTLLFLRNHYRRKVKRETEKVNKSSNIIPTYNITKSNDLIYAGAKLVVDKIGTLKDRLKPKLEMTLDRQIYKRPKLEKTLSGQILKDTKEGRDGKVTADKTDKITGINRSKYTCKIKETKMIPGQGHAIQPHLKKKKKKSTTESSKTMKENSTEGSMANAQRQIN